MKRNNMNLQLFAYKDYGTSNFFEEAFASAYTSDDNDDNSNTDVPSDPIEAPVSDDTDEVDEIPGDDNETPDDVPQDVTDDVPDVATPQLTKEELIEAFKTSQTPVYDEETQQAIELMNYLKENPHLVGALRDTDPTAYQEMNNFVPDEMTRKMQEFEEFMVEQQYQKVVQTMKTKYSDYDEEKVLEFAEQHDIADLEVAYKALSADSKPKFDLEAERTKLREQIKAEVMKEMRENASNTSTIVGSGGDVPPVQDEVVITQQEKRVAQMLGMSVDEYTKYRDNR
jgi:hypothetical protein